MDIEISIIKHGRYYAGGEDIYIQCPECQNPTEPMKEMIEKESMIAFNFCCSNCGCHFIGKTKVSIE